MRCLLKPGAACPAPFFAVSLIVAAGLTGPAHGDTTKSPIPTWKGAIAGALGDENTALHSFYSSRGFARAAGLKAGDIGSPKPVARKSVKKSTDSVAAPTRSHLPVARFGLDRTSLAKVKITKRTKQWKCLTEALYFEARGESRPGQIAVAEVILNRVDSALYPNSVCKVVQQGQHRRNGCQFSYNCDGKRNRIGNDKVFERLGKLAFKMMQNVPRKLTGEALYYHNTSVKPRWVRKLVRTAKIGSHIFYRPAVKLTRR